VVRDTEVAIAEKDREALQRKLEIDRASKEAELTQQRDIANATAKTRAEQAEKEAAARQAEETARIASELAIAEREAEAKRIKENANIAASRAVQQSELEAKRDVQIVAQESAIAVANKSREESEAKAAAKEAEALAVAADEKVATAREVEIAERHKRIAVIAAQQDAETEATNVTVAAEAEKDAAENRAQAIKIIALANADAAKIEAEAIREKGAAQAEAEAAMTEARNKLSPDIIEFELTRERIRIIPAALAEAVRPIEKIKDIRIFDTGGLINGKANGDGAGVGLGDGLAGQLLALQANKPIVNSILAEAGFAGGSNALDSLLGSVTAKEATKVEGVPDGADRPTAPAGPTKSV
jgi:flotillin